MPEFGPGMMGGGLPERKVTRTKKEKPPESERSKEVRKMFGIQENNKLFNEKDGKFFIGEEPIGKWWNRQLAELDMPSETWYENL